MNHNLYTQLKSFFPADRHTAAIESILPDGGTRTYSWEELDALSAKIAHKLQALELPPASRIAVQVEKSVEAIALYLGTVRAGHVFLPLNTAYKKGEMEYFIQNAEPAVLVCTSLNLDGIHALADSADIQHVFTLDGNGTGSLLADLDLFASAFDDVHCTADALAAILYTSGTTGRSKGAMLSHGNLMANAHSLKQYWGWKDGDVLIHALPIFHVHGLFIAIHAALINGSKMIWLSKFDAKQVIAQLPKATVLMGVPTFYVRMLSEPSLTPEIARHMRLFISGSAPLLIETFNEWKVRTGHTILERYGMSETIIISSNPYTPDSRYQNQSERCGSTVGFPLPEMALRITNDANQPLAQGEIGNIQVQGESVFSGYWRMPEKTAEEFTQDGWFKTGDVGVIDPRGYLRIVGRNKDLIISGGYNVYPAEIEAMVNELPGVEESAVVGVPHADFGEAGVLLLIAKPGVHIDEQQVLERLKTQLAAYKVPKRCHVIAELPRNAMGKVQKNILRQTYQDSFALVC
jgi:malonyl-CoA/methylmalonyl-CoA synthetase